MELNKYKPDKIKVVDIELLENDTVQSDQSPCKIISDNKLDSTYDSNQTCSTDDLNKLIGDHSQPDSYPPLLTYTSSLDSSNLQEYGAHHQLSDEFSETKVNNELKTNVVAARKRNRYKLKVKQQSHKTQIDEGVQCNVIGESTCKRFVKYNCLIAEGKHKKIYKGFDRTSVCDIAWCQFKTIPDEGKENHQFMLKEIETLMKLDHPHIVKYYGVLKIWWSIKDDTQYSRTEEKGLVIIQELMNKVTLKGMVKDNFRDGQGILDVNLITKLWYQILDALRYIHSVIDPPLFHRNLKLENCFLHFHSNDNVISAKLGNFGLFTSNRDESNRNIMGTAGFMVPEVFRVKYDSKSDIHDLGILLLETFIQNFPCDESLKMFQIGSRSIGKYLPDIISNIEHPYVKEIITGCLHPIPEYRPTAEELCEHPLFEKTLVRAELIYSDLNNSRAFFNFLNNLFKNEVRPIADLQIMVDCVLLPDQSDFAPCKFIILSFDIYQAHLSNFSDILAALKTCLENEIISSEKINRLDHLLSSIHLQLQYLTKILIGERWRQIFNILLNTTHMGDLETDSSKSTVDSRVNKESVPTNFTHFNASVYDKATKLLNSEIQTHSHEFQSNNLPSFFNMRITDQPSRDIADEYLLRMKLRQNQNSLEPSTESNSTSPNSMNLKSWLYDTRSKIEVTPNEEQTNNGKITCEGLYETCSDCTNIKEISDLNLQNEFQTSFNRIVEPSYTVKNENYETNSINQIKPSHVSNDRINMISKQNSLPEVRYNQIHFRHFSEPQFLYTSNPNYPLKSVYPIGSNLNSGTFHSRSETQSHQNIYQSSHPQFKFNQDSNQYVGFPSNLNPQSVIGRKNNLFYQHQLSQQQFLNYIQSNFLSSQSNLVVSPQNPLSSESFSGLYGGICYPQSVFINNSQNPNIMHNNVQYTNLGEPIPRHQHSEPILTRSLPSIIGSPTISSESAIATGVIQTSLASALPSRMPVITNTSMSNDLCSSQRQILVPSNSAQKLNPGLSTSRPIINRSQTTVSPIPNTKQQPQTHWKVTHSLNNTSGSQLTYPPINDRISVPLFILKTRSESTSSIIPSSPTNNKKVVRGRSFSQIQEKTKLKKTKTRLKSRYLLKIIEISEIPATSEVILVFEALLPMNQMRFSCSLNNEIDCLDPSKFVGDSGQIPGELRKKDILESLVSTVQKICHCLLEDINSISLNEDYVFHPLIPGSTLVKFSDCIYQMQISSEIYDSPQPSFQTTNQLAFLNTIPSYVLPNPVTGSCASSRSLSRQASNDDLSLIPITGPTSETIENPWLPSSEMELINPLLCDSTKPVNVGADLLKKPTKPQSAHETDCSRTVKITSKCTCNPSSKDCCIRIPEFLFPSVKQIIDKLQNPHTKGLIILPQSNEILLKNLRVLEVPIDHMFFGLPCADSSFNVVKGDKDKDFIIARDTRGPESSGQSKKCVYQTPTEGAVLVDSSGEVQYFKNPSLVIPHSQSKAQIKELPSELTHNKNQSLDCNQIVSVLQSLSMIQNSSDLTKDETFDSPVMLEPASSPPIVVSTDRTEVYDSSLVRRGSGDSVSAVPVTQTPSQVQVEYVSFHYVPLSKPTGSSVAKPDIEFTATIDIGDRDLPRQQVRSRKISNESLEAVSSGRPRCPVYMNEIEHLMTHQQIQQQQQQMQQQQQQQQQMQQQQQQMQQQQQQQQMQQQQQQQMQQQQQQQMQQQQQANLQKMMVTNQMSIPGTQRNMLNQIPMSRLPNVPPGHSSQFVLATATAGPNPGTQSLIKQHVPAPVAQYPSNSAPIVTNAVTGPPIVVTQPNTSISVVLPTPNPMGLSFAPIIPNQTGAPSSKLSLQMAPQQMGSQLTSPMPQQMGPQLHLQSGSQLANPRIVTPISSQHLANLVSGVGLPLQNLISVSQSLMPGAGILPPGYTGTPLMHSAIPSAVVAASCEPHFTEFIQLKDPGASRQQQVGPSANPTGIRQFGLGTPYYDAGGAVMLGDPGMRMRFTQPLASSGVQQPQAIRFVPYAVTTASSAVGMVSGLTPPLTATGIISPPKFVLSDKLEPATQIQVVAGSINPVHTTAPVATTMAPVITTTTPEQTIGRFVIRAVTDNPEKIL